MYAEWKKKRTLTFEQRTQVSGVTGYITLQQCISTAVAAASPFLPHPLSFSRALPALRGQHTSVFNFGGISERVPDLLLREEGKIVASAGFLLLLSTRKNNENSSSRNFSFGCFARSAYVRGSCWPLCFLFFSCFFQAQFGFILC